MGKPTIRLSRLRREWKQARGQQRHNCETPYPRIYLERFVLERQVEVLEARVWFWKDGFDKALAEVQRLRKENERLREEAEEVESEPHFVELPPVGEFEIDLTITGFEKGLPYARGGEGDDDA